MRFLFHQPATMPTNHTSSQTKAKQSRQIQVLPQIFSVPLSSTMDAKGSFYNLPKGAGQPANLGTGIDSFGMTTLDYFEAIYAAG